MNIDDLLVEVRTSSLERVGAILKEDLKLDAEIPFNAVGTWTITISQDHPLARVLAGPGGGIVATDLSSGEVLFSGPTVQPEESRSTENLSGEIVVQGITDETVLDDALAWPDPINGDVSSQTVDQDERSGTTEAVVHGYIAANIGPFAPTGRRNPRLVMADQLGIGTGIDSTARFDKLLTLAQNLSLPDGMGFRVRQRGSQLVFETFMPRDQRRLVRLSLENDGLSTSRLAASAPTLTRAIVAGKGGVTTRLFREVINADSLSAESDWGRRIELFVDQQDTRNTDTMTRAGEEALKDGGYTSTNARFEPTETFRGTYGSEWELGDTITVETADRSYTAPVTAVIYKVSADDGFRLGAILGDPAAFNEYASLSTRLDKVKSSTEATATKPTVPVDEIANTLKGRLDANDDVLAELDVKLADNADIMDQLQLDLAASAEAIEDIGTTANGKNSVKYETFAPTNQPNNPGDIWYVRTVSPPRVTAQYEGLGGTSWRSVTLTNIVVTSLDAGAITSGSINAAQIAVYNLNASNITAGTINAANIAVTNINASNITAGTINAANVAVTNINASNITTGTLSANRIDLNTLNGKTINGVNITGGSVSVTDVMTVNSAGFLLNADIAIISGGTFAIFANLSLGPGNSVNAPGGVTGSTVSMSNGVTGQNLTANSQTGAAAGDAEFSNGGVVRRKASTRRIKREFAPLEDTYSAEILLQLEPQTFLRLDPQVPGWVPDLGFVAEDAEELGLEKYVVRNLDGTVQGFQYTNWTAALQVIVRHQAQQITDLATRIEALESA